MLSVDMETLWSDEAPKIVQGISEATDNMIAYRANPVASLNALREVCQDIRVICSFWTGKTYIGVPKEPTVKEAFQSFFTELMELLLELKESKIEFESSAAKYALYQGTVYRYLGSACPYGERVMPQFDEHYVSWSKCFDNNVKRDLYGPITFLTCEISGQHYGIDLEAIECDRPNEHEVVFPTIQECITKIKYLDEPDDETHGY